jgi:hypothetical protein
MNEGRRCASEWVQPGARKVAAKINEPGHPTGHPAIPLKEETTMLKTISAALLAVSVLAAPAMAAGTGKTAQAPVIKAEQVKTGVLNANARMDRHHRHFRHHRFHKHMGALKTHHVAKATIKQVTPAAKRG